MGDLIENVKSASYGCLLLGVLSGGRGGWVLQKLKIYELKEYRLLIFGVCINREIELRGNCSPTTKTSRKYSFLSVKSPKRLYSKRNKPICTAYKAET